MLNAYPTLGAGATIWVDNGNYDLSSNIALSAAHWGVRIVGYNSSLLPPNLPQGFVPSATRSTVLDRGNTSSGQYVFELDGATGVTLDDLGITGGYDGIYAGSGAQSTGLAVSNCQVYGNASEDIVLDTSNDDAMLTGNTVYDAPTGINVAGVGDTVSGNKVYATSTGITSYFANWGVAGVTISGNTVHDNSSAGIDVTGNVLASGNTVYRQTSGAGIVVWGGVAQQNVVHDNYYGISVSFYGVNGQALDNQVYNNSQAGIYVYSGGAIVQGNTVYSNGVGVRLFTYGNDQLSNNLIYDNLDQGVLVNDVTSYYGGARSPTTRSISRWAMPSTSRAAPAASPWRTTSFGHRPATTCTSPPTASRAFAATTTTSAPPPPASWPPGKVRTSRTWPTGFMRPALTSTVSAPIPSFSIRPGPTGSSVSARSPTRPYRPRLSITTARADSAPAAHGPWAAAAATTTTTCRARPPPTRQPTPSASRPAGTRSARRGRPPTSTTIPTTRSSTAVRPTAFRSTRCRWTRARRRPTTPPPGLPGKTWASFTSAALRSPCRSPEGLPRLPWLPTRCRSSVCRGTTARTTTSTCRAPRRPSTRAIRPPPG